MQEALSHHLPRHSEHAPPLTLSPLSMSLSIAAAAAAAISTLVLLAASFFQRAACCPALLLSWVAVFLVRHGPGVWPLTSWSSFLPATGVAVLSTFPLLPPGLGPFVPASDMPDLRGQSLPPVLAFIIFVVACFTTPGPLSRLHAAGLVAAFACACALTHASDASILAGTVGHHASLTCRVFPLTMLFLLP
jgi:hypothetical protein